MVRKIKLNIRLVRQRWKRRISRCEVKKGEKWGSPEEILEARFVKRGRVCTKKMKKRLKRVNQ